MRSPSQPGAPVADPDVGATVRLLHRRQGWVRLAVTCFIAFVLAVGASASAHSQGAAAPADGADAGLDSLALAASAGHRDGH